MGFDVTEAGPFGAADAVERAELVEQQVFHFLRGTGHRAAAKTDQIRVGRVGADTHAVLHRQRDGAAHGGRVGGVKAAGDVGAVHMRHHGLVHAHGPGAEAFAHVAVEL